MTVNLEAYSDASNSCNTSVLIGWSRTSLPQGNGWALRGKAVRGKKNPLKS